MAEWYSLWAQAHSPVPQKNFVRPNQTISLWFVSGLSGSKLRIRLENCSKEQVTRVGEVTVYVEDRCIPITFKKKKSIDIMPDTDVYSDEYDCEIRSGCPVEIRIYYPSDCKFTSGGRSFAAASVSAPGNYTNQEWQAAKRIFKTMMKTTAGCGDVEAVIPALGGIEIYSDSAKGVIVAFGDSITQQGTWVRALGERLLKESCGTYSLINKGIGGNRLLHDAGKMKIYGDSGLHRMHHDIGIEQNVKTVILALGTNDIGLPGTGLLSDSLEELPKLAEYQKGVECLVDQLHKKNIRVIGTSILPRRKPEGFILKKLLTYTKQQEKLRCECNEWLRSAEIFDGFLDYDAFAQHPYRQGLRREMDRGDGLHLSWYGGMLLADAIDLSTLIS